MDLDKIDVYDIPFMTYEDIFDIKSGVYFLFSIRYGELLYIGQSKKIRSRISNHISTFKDLYSYTRHLDRFILGYKVLPVEPENLDEVEHFFIEKYNPPMNSEHSTKPLADRESYKMWVWKRIEEYDKAEKCREHSWEAHNGT